jgi:hypothetical protein
MRSAAVSALLLAASSVVAAPAPSPKTVRPNREPSAAQVREKRRVAAAFLRPGMTREHVIELLGDPSITVGCGNYSISIYPDLGVAVHLTREGRVQDVRRHPEETF